jgi:hypothetical protein
MQQDGSLGDRIGQIINPVVPAGNGKHRVGDKSIEERDPVIRIHFLSRCVCHFLFQSMPGVAKDNILGEGKMESDEGDSTGCGPG